MKKTKSTSRNIYYRTDILFPRTNAFIGMGSILNIAGNYFKFNTCRTAHEADCRAIENDWGTIGQDIIKTVRSNPKKRP